MPHIDLVHGVTLLYRMEESRTKPFVLTCMNNKGHQSDFVVKLHSQIAGGILGEFWCAKLGDLLGMPMPNTALVNIDRALGEYNADFREALAVDGPHFGSEQIVSRPLTLYDGFNVPHEHFDTALEIFVFDILIQNPDRRQLNPNLYFAGNRFWMIDHELALSFEGLLGGAPMPWDIPRRDQLFVNHVLYQILKGKVTEEKVAAFGGRLTRVTKRVIEEIAGDVPNTWNHPAYNTAIVNYLLKVIDDLPRFQRGILEVLA